MERLRVRHLPVVEDGRVIGIVSTRLLMARRAEYLNRRVEERTAELRRANDELLARDAEMLHNLRAAGRLQTQAAAAAVAAGLAGTAVGGPLRPARPPRRRLLRLRHPGPGPPRLPDRRRERAQHRGGDGGDHGPVRVRRGGRRHAQPRRGARRDEPPAPGVDRRAVRDRVLRRARPPDAGASATRTPATRTRCGSRRRPGAVRPLAAQGFMLGIMPDEVYAREGGAARTGRPAAASTPTA